MRGAQESVKIKWSGIVESIQPRTRVWRYITDNRTHYHLGYNIFISGKSDEGKTEFCIAVSEKQQNKAMFTIGDRVKGTGWTKKYPKREYADYYRAGALKVVEKNIDAKASVVPWTGKLPSMDTYEKRGARMLSKKTWKNKCFKCYWANMANVEIQWDFDRDIKKYRFETFCYGPVDCPNYKRGRARAVPYKNRGSFMDDGMLDDLCIEQRDEYFVK